MLADVTFTITIRADASPRIGTGHVMRCMALAQAAKAQGMDVCMVGRYNIPWLKVRLIQEGVSFIQLKDDVPLVELPSDLLAQICDIPPSSWVVLDGYHFGPDCQQAVRKAGYKLLVIDDYNPLSEYHCDILLNQNIGAEQFKYHGNIDKKLLGLEFVLLRPEFAAAREKSLQRVLPQVPLNILLTLGGGDFSTHLQNIAPCFNLAEMHGRTLRVIAGAMSEEGIRNYLRDCPAHIEILSSVEDIPALLLNTDLCITAGGSTCWELSCLGVPFLMIVVAENQRKIVYFLSEVHNIPIFNEKNFISALQCLPSVPFGICSAYGAKKVLQDMMLV